MRHLLSVVALTTVAFAAQFTLAAELRLRAECTPAGPVVTLGDVAEISAADARQATALAAIELFSAPLASEEKTLRLREIQDLLLLHGVNLSQLQFSGSSEVSVQTRVVRPRAASDRPVSPAEISRTKRRLCDAIEKYLNERSAGPQDWSIEFELAEAAARLLASPTAQIEVSGGNAPWTGSQRFQIASAGSQGPVEMSVDATVRVIAPVVVAVHALARGEVIREGDVVLQRAAAADKLAGAMHSLEQAIGHELFRAVGAGSPVTVDSLRTPIVVHRGEVVSVLARAGGVRIRTNARSRDDGSVGELVAVESLANRAAYYARVSGAREVEVYARPPQVENEK